MNQKIKHLPYVIDENNRFDFYENYWKRVGLKLLQQHYELKNKTFLDYGCGRGESLKIFKAAGMKVTGLDIDPTCVELSSQYATTELITLDKPFGDYTDKAFDVVGCFHVLEHVDNPRMVLTRLGQLARDYVVIAVPNLNVLNRIFSRGGKKLTTNEGHLQAWDHAHFLNLAERYCGLKLVAWGHDATILSGISRLLAHSFGRRAAIYAETKIFNKFFPFHCTSVLALLKPEVTDSEI
jgi:SAM-dependent methyltransferase